MIVSKSEFLALLAGIFPVQLLTQQHKPPEPQLTDLLGIEFLRNLENTFYKMILGLEEKPGPAHMTQQIETARIERLVHGGSGLCRINGKVVFVPHTVPGEMVEIKIQRRRARHDEGIAQRIIDPSPKRIPSLCKYFQRCGGCHLQHIGYEHQLSFKEEIFRETLQRLAHVHGSMVLPAIPSPAAFGYRNRIRLHVKNRRVGFFAGGSHELIAIERCAIAHPVVNQILYELTDAFPQADLELLSGIEIVADIREEKGMVILETNRRAGNRLIYCPALPCVKKWFIQGRDGSGSQGVTMQDAINFRMPAADNIYFAVFPGVFSQVNLQQNSNLLGLVLKWAEITARDKVLDLFCGMGNFSLPAARRAVLTIGVDENPLSIENALFNATANHIGNVRFLDEDVASAVERLVREKNTFDVVFIDPPRTGCHDIIPGLSGLNPSRILYVSCDPATLARDIKHFGKQGFALVRSQPVDMFPQTYHIESLSLFMR